MLKLKQVEFENYKCLQHVSVELEPLTLLVGPNNSGKSSFLEAIQFFRRSMSEPIFSTNPQLVKERHRLEHLVWMGEKLPMRWAATLEVTDQQSVDYSFRAEPSESASAKGWRLLDEQFTVRGSDGSKDLFLWFEADWPSLLQKNGQFEPVRRHSPSKTFLPTLSDRNNSRDPAFSEEREELANFFLHFQTYKFIPQALGKPTPLQLEQVPMLETDGSGLPLVLDWLLNEHRELFVKIEESLQRFTSLIHRIRLPLVKIEAEEGVLPGKGIEFELVRTGKRIPASLVSDGILLMLAYLTLIHHPQKPSLMMLEEPDAHIHPRQVEFVMQNLRAINQGQFGDPCQMILTTHNPLFVNFAEPQEVRIFKRQEDGATTIQPMKDVKGLERYRKIMDLGEIWYNLGEDNLVG